MGLGLFCLIFAWIKQEGEIMPVPTVDLWATLPNIIIRGIEIGAAMGGLLIASLMIRKKKLAKQLKKNESEIKPDTKSEIQP